MSAATAEEMLLNGEKRWTPNMSDVKAALHVTGKDSKMNYEAARRLLAMGRAAVHEAKIEMSKLPGWTVHWSNSKKLFFYSNRTTKSPPLTKGEDCPWGWAKSASGSWYFHINRQDAPQSAPPSRGIKRPIETSGVTGHESKQAKRPLLPKAGLKATLAERVWELVATDSRVGFPPAGGKPVEKNPHGWFFPPHKIVMANLMNSETKCVMELGSWLGKSTRFITSQAPNAFIMCIDLWSNDHIRDDPHYTAIDGASDFMANKAARERQIQENMKIINDAPIYDVFLKNMWDWRADASTKTPGVVPLKMTTFEGIELLHQHNIEPEAIYVDASHHYDDVIKELTLCREYFPNAEICGDDWDYPPVRRAAEDCAKQEMGRTGKELRIHAEGDKCWTFAQIPLSGLRAARAKYQEADVSHAAKALFSRVEAEIKSGDHPHMLAQVLAPLEGKQRVQYVNLLYPPKGRSMLMLAASKGHVGCVEALLTQWGADPNAQTKQKGETALHLAAYGGHAQVVRLLLAHKASTLLQNEYQETAFQTAQSAKNSECAALIREAERHIH